LVDFLQKKLVDRWLRRFVIVSGALLNERFFFELATRFYLDFIVWTGHRYATFEFKSVGSTLLLTALIWVVVFLMAFLFTLLQQVA